MRLFTKVHRYGKAFTRWICGWGLLCVPVVGSVVQSSSVNSLHSGIFWACAFCWGAGRCCCNSNFHLLHYCTCSSMVGACSDTTPEAAGSSVAWPRPRTRRSRGGARGAQGGRGSSRRQSAPACWLRGGLGRSVEEKSELGRGPQRIGTTSLQKTIQSVLFFHCLRLGF